MKRGATWLRRLRTWIWTLFAVCCIGLALLVGAGSLLLPYADRFQGEVEQWLSQRLGHAVAMEGLEANWTASGPRLWLRDLRVGAAGQGSLTLPLAEVSFDIYSWLRPGSGSAVHFRMISDQAELVRSESGQWRFEQVALKLQDKAFDISQLPGTVSLGVDQLVFRDQAKAAEITFTNVDIRLQPEGDTLVLSAALTAPGGGEVALSLKAQAGLEFPASVEAYVRAKNLDLASWLSPWPIAGVQIVRGQAQLEVWGQWRRGDSMLHGRLRLDELQLSATEGLPIGDAEVMPVYALEHLRGGIQWRSQADGEWRLDLTDAVLERGEQRWPRGDVVISRRPGQDHAFSYAVAADFIRLQDLTDAAVVIAALPQDVRSGLYGLAPRGDITALRIDRLSWDPSPAAFGQMKIDGLSLTPHAGIPGLSGISAELDLQGKNGAGTVAVRDGFVEFPGVLRWPMPLDWAESELRWSHRDEQWGLQLSGLELRSQALAAAGRLQIWLGQGKPFIDSQVEVFSGAVAQAKYLWPINRFNPRLVEWLDSALISGRVTAGTLLLHGDMDDWPFAAGQGRFEATAQIEQGVVNFHPQWPQARELNASVRFGPEGMHMTAFDGAIEGLRLQRADIALAHYREPRLELMVDGLGEGASLLEFLRVSPLYAGYADYVDGLTLEGRSEIHSQLELPLKLGLPAREITGHVRLQDARVEATEWDVVLERTNGRVEFSDQGIQASELKASFEGFDAVVSLRSGDYVQTAGVAAEVELDTLAPGRVFFADIAALTPLIEHLPDACQWQARLTVPTAGEPVLTLASDLVGTPVHLPPPLNKPAGVPLALRVEQTLHPDRTDFHVNIGESLARLHMMIEDDRWRGIARLGAGQLGEVPEQGLYVSGQVGHLDLDHWRRLSSEWVDFEGLNQDQMWLQGVDITVDQLHLAARQLGFTQVMAQRDQEYWALQLDGDWINGRLRLPVISDGSRLMLGEFQRLVWPGSEEEVEDIGLPPSRFPPIQFLAEDLVVEEVPFGRVSFESYPTAQGMHIVDFQAQSPVMSIDARGDWLGVPGSSETQSRFNATITGEDLGGILGAFGFSGVVKGGQSVVRLNTHWVGAPSDFEFALLGGEMNVEIGKGQIVEVDPGAGRLFGLLSLQAMPRRLGLDFADLFASGLVFDGVRGSFQLQAGNAYTEDLVIDGPTAKIFVVGRTGLDEQDYDQIITVVPRVDNALPWVGALAGGGAGAIAALLLQNVFSDQIDRMTQFHYSVTGPWEDPQVSLLRADVNGNEPPNSSALR